MASGVVSELSFPHEYCHILIARHLQCPEHQRDPSFGH